MGLSFFYCSNQAKHYNLLVLSAVRPFFGATISVYAPSLFVSFILPPFFYKARQTNSQNGGKKEGGGKAKGIQAKHALLKPIFLFLISPLKAKERVPVP